MSNGHSHRPAGIKTTAKAKDCSGRFLNWEFWRRQLVYRTTGYRTTWKLRLLVVGLLLVLPIATRTWWVPALGWSLVSDSEFERPDLILIDNLDHDFQLFEKAADLQRRGIGKEVLVPVHASWQDPEQMDPVERGIAEVMSREAHLHSAKFLRIRGKEPITLNAARTVADSLKGSRVKTVLIVTSGFKSKRIRLIFSKVLSEVGIDAYCLPVWGAHRPGSWTASWHGMQEVFLQLAKLGYYRLWVL
jgi:hypothetical protein